jgi:hypothetical protein
MQAPMSHIPPFYGPPSRLDSPLVAYSEGRMSKPDAIKALGLRDYAQLLISLGYCDLPLPRLPEAELKSMEEIFVNRITRRLPRR